MQEQTLKNLVTASATCNVRARARARTRFSRSLFRSAKFLLQNRAILRNAARINYASGQL